MNREYWTPNNSKENLHFFKNKNNFKKDYDIFEPKDGMI